MPFSKQTNVGDHETLVFRRTANNELVAEPLVPKQTMLDGAWLDGLTIEQLVEVSFQISAELKRRMQSATARITSKQAQAASAPSQPDAPTFRDNVDSRSVQYTRLPVNRSKKSSLEAAETTWRIMMVSANPAHDIIGLEVFDDIVIGRSSEEAGAARLDLNLADFEGSQMGVSRRHAVMRPGMDQLLVFDLDSTNGTRVNGSRLDANRAYKLKNGDTLAFGELQFKVKVVTPPPEKVV